MIIDGAFFAAMKRTLAHGSLASSPPQTSFERKSTRSKFDMSENLDDQEKELLALLAKVRLQKEQAKHKTLKMPTDIPSHEEDKENANDTNDTNDAPPNDAPPSDAPIRTPLAPTSTCANMTSKYANGTSESSKDCATSSSYIPGICERLANIPETAETPLPTSPATLPTSREHGWEALVEEWLEEVANSTLTRKRYRKQVNAFRDFVGVGTLPKDLKKEHFQRYADTVWKRKLATNTNRAYLIPIKSFGTFLVGYYGKRYNPGNVIKLEKKVRTKDHVIPDPDMDTILNESAGKKQEFFAMLYFGGFRVFEACKLKYKDIVLEEKEELPNDEFQASRDKRNGFRRRHSKMVVSVVGKGNKPRSVTIGRRGRSYLEHLARHPNKEQYVFPGRDPRCHMAIRTGQYWVQKFCERNGLMIDELCPKKHTMITPHTFRRKYIIRTFILTPCGTLLTFHPRHGGKQCVRQGCRHRGRQYIPWARVEGDDGNLFARYGKVRQCVFVIDEFNCNLNIHIFYTSSLLRFTPLMYTYFFATFYTSNVYMNACVLSISGGCFCSTDFTLVCWAFPPVSPSARRKRAFSFSSACIFASVRRSYSTNCS